MKKIKIFLVIIIITIFMIPTMVNATTITKAEYTNKKITVSGTGEILETIQIALFDSEGNVKYLTTTKADNNGNYEVTLPQIEGITEGNYTVKTASYDGKKTSSANMKVEFQNEQDNNNVNNGINENTTNPKTGDNIILILVLLGIALVGLIVTFKVRKNNVKEVTNK